VSFFLNATVTQDRNFVVLGGAGTIGRIVARDLIESHPKNSILIADFNEDAARKTAGAFRSRRVRAAFADATQVNELVRVLRGHSVVVNCTQHDFNLNVMQAALAAKVHYIDLGGLFTWTRRQLKLHQDFLRVGLTAIIGMGCSPGITNIMAHYVASRFQSIQSIRIRVGSRDSSAAANNFCFPYSAQTVVEELSLRPWIFKNGRFLQTAARTGWEEIDFKKPLGKLWLVRTRHSEVATLPLSFREKGVRECDFKVSFDRHFVREVMKRLRNGWTVKRLSEWQSERMNPDDYEVARVVITGWEHSARVRTSVTMDCHARAKPEWQATAGDVDTACPPSIVAQMLAAGRINQLGVLPPEIGVPVDPFLRELKKRGMKWTISRTRIPTG
jgi:saccharopine dehydrogenase-like NADP-dependent oxidoreductase